MPEIRPITGSCVWHGDEMAGSPRWQRSIIPRRSSPRSTARSPPRRRGGWEVMDAADFPLPAFAPLADDIRGELEEGSGIVLLRGITPGRYSPDALKLLYTGLCRHIGTLVYSNRGGERMREIRDVGRDAGMRYGALPEGKKAGAFLSSYARTLTNQQLRFHTDRCDVVALFCVRQAMHGGVSKLCSSPAVHNAMLERRPDLAAALYNNLWRSRFGEEDTTDASSYPLPVWGVRGGKFTSHYSRTFIEVAQRRPATEVPRLSPAQTEALDLLHDLAEELCFEMSFAPGDIQFVNNHVIYHARTAFEDDPAQGADRLLLRLWMAVPNSRALPPATKWWRRSTDYGHCAAASGRRQRRWGSTTKGLNGSCPAPVLSGQEQAGYTFRLHRDRIERAAATWHQLALLSDRFAPARMPSRAGHDSPKRKALAEQKSNSFLEVVYRALAHSQQRGWCRSAQLAEEAVLVIAPAARADRAVAPVGRV